MPTQSQSSTTEHTALLFPGGVTLVRKPTTEQLVASALDWQKMAEEDAADLDKPGALGEFERTILAARLQRHLAKARAALQEIGR